VGIISDTHDRLDYIDKAVKKLNQEKVDLTLHAGDFSAPFVVPRFKSLKSKLIGVFGNNDAEKNLLINKFNLLGAKIKYNFEEIKIEGLRIGLLHGDDIGLLKSLVNTEYYNVIVHGHTHFPKIEKSGKVLKINPGEVCGYLSNQSTIALLDTKTKESKIYCI
jgi:putative phosphoesterase